MQMFDVYSLMNVTPEKVRGSYVWDINGQQYHDLLWRPSYHLHWSQLLPFCAADYAAIGENGVLFQKEDLNLFLNNLQVVLKPKRAEIKK